MTFNQDGSIQSSQTLQTIDILGKHATKHALLGEEFQKEMTGSGMVQIVGIKHLLSENPEGCAIIAEIPNVED